MLLKIVMSKSQQLLLAPPLPDQPQSYRQPLRMRSSWNGNGRKSGQGCLNGKNIGQVHNDRVICFFAQFESRGWRCRKKHKIVGLQQLKKSVPDQSAYLLGLGIISIVITGAQHKGAQHDSPFNFFSESFSSGPQIGRSEERRVGNECVVRYDLVGRRNFKKKELN